MFYGFQGIKTGSLVLLLYFRNVITRFVSPIWKTASNLNVKTYLNWSIDFRQIIDHNFYSVDDNIEQAYKNSW